MIRTELEKDLVGAVFSDDADQAIYAPASGAQYSIRGWFLQPALEVEEGGYVPFPAVVPKFKARESSIRGGSKKGDKLIYLGTTYEIKEAKHSGAGVADLVLIRT